VISTRGGQGAVLSAEGIPRLPLRRLRGLGAGQAVLPEETGQSPPASAAGEAVHRPGRPACREDHLRDGDVASLTKATYRRVDVGRNILVPSCWRATRRELAGTLGATGADVRTDPLQIPFGHLGREPPA